MNIKFVLFPKRFYIPLLNRRYDIQEYIYLSLFVPQREAIISMEKTSNKKGR